MTHFHFGDAAYSELSIRAGDTCSEAQIFHDNQSQYKSNLICNVQGKDIRRYMYFAGYGFFISFYNGPTVLVT